jgi:putative GTP pyrophosphokinase
LAGIRIIAYLGSKLEDIYKLVSKAVDVIEVRDKYNERGYNARHLIGTISKERKSLPEYQEIKDIQFEIQFKTILAHAWAEIEHDRIYKYEGKVPRGVKEAFKNSAAKLLNIDKTFQKISDTIKSRPDEIFVRIQGGNLNIPIDAISLKQYIKIRYGDIPTVQVLYGVLGTRTILAELTSMGIHTLSDLEEINGPKLREEIIKLGKYSGLRANISSVVRDILMVHDTKKYFQKAWNEHFRVMHPDSLNVLQESGADTYEIMRHLTIGIHGLG